MQVGIKLFGGLVCRNVNLSCHGLDRFQLEVQEGSTLGDIHKLLNLSPMENLVIIVNGHAQSSAYVINKECNISFFPPMADRQYDFFRKI